MSSVQMVATTFVFLFPSHFRSPGQLAGSAPCSKPADRFFWGTRQVMLVIRYAVVSQCHFACITVGTGGTCLVSLWHHC